MISAFANCLKIPELRNRIFFTMGMVFVSRIITAVPTPGVNAAELERAITAAQQKTGGGILGWLDLFAGGALSRCAVGALTIWPYISASIIIQLMTAIVPTLERLQQEGETGRQKITQYTRYLTLAISLKENSYIHGEAFNFGPNSSNNKSVNEVISLMNKNFDNSYDLEKKLHNLVEIRYMFDDEYKV